MYHIQLLCQAKLDSSYVWQSVLWHESKVYILWVVIKSYWYTVSLQLMILLNLVMFSCFRKARREMKWSSGVNSKGWVKSSDFVWFPVSIATVLIVTPSDPGLQVSLLIHPNSETRNAKEFYLQPDNCNSGKYSFRQLWMSTPKKLDC